MRSCISMFHVASIDYLWITTVNITCKMSVMVTISIFYIRFEMLLCIFMVFCIILHNNIETERIRGQLDKFSFEEAHSHDLHKINFMHSTWKKASSWKESLWGASLVSSTRERTSFIRVSLVSSLCGGAMNPNFLLKYIENWKLNWNLCVLSIFQQMNGEKQL